MSFKKCLFVVSMVVLMTAQNADAFGVSPGVLKVDPLMVGQKQTVYVTVGRTQTALPSKIRYEVLGSIADFVRIEDASQLALPTGSRSALIPVVFDATKLTSGQTYTGQISFKEVFDAGSDAASLNLPGIAVQVFVNVSDNDTTLLRVHSISTTWDNEQASVALTFTEQNNRFVPGHVAAARFTITEPGSQTATARDVLIEGNLLEPGAKAIRAARAPIDDSLVGLYVVEVDLLDEQGRSVYKTAPAELLLNPDIQERQKTMRRYLLIAAGALLVAGGLIADYLYLKRRRLKKAR